MDGHKENKKHKRSNSSDVGYMVHIRVDAKLVIVLAAGQNSQQVSRNIDEMKRESTRRPLGSPKTDMEW